MDNHDIARAFRELGQLLEVTGESPFKTRAYFTASDRIAALPEPIEKVAAEGRLQEIPGIGPAIAKKIETMLATGSMPQLEKLRAEFPPGAVELVQVPELGPRKVKAVIEAGIGSVDELEDACREGRVASIKGFGAKTQAKILEGIASWRKFRERRPLADVLPRAEDLLAWARESPAVERAEIAGGVRRFQDAVGGLELVVGARDVDEAAEHLSRFREVREISREDGVCRLRFFDGLQAEAHVVPPEGFAAALLLHTGAPGHLARLAALATDRGLKSLSTEREIYESLGLPEIPPELREDEGELEAALEGRLPRLIEITDIRGMTHCHTTWSDGKASVAEMARAAKLLGMEYVTITDHSQSSGYAGGLTPDRLKQQWEEIERAREEVPGIAILRGSEVDILQEGELDFDEAILEQLDVVIGSIHQRYGLDGKGQTRRIVRALRNPLLSWIGHPTGRLVGSREPYALDMEEVLGVAGETGKAMECNGTPYRLDLSAEHVRHAVRKGIKLVVSVDAHSTAGMGALRYGVGTARRGWATAADVLNTLPVGRFLAALRHG